MFITTKVISPATTTMDMKISHPEIPMDPFMRASRSATGPVNVPKVEIALLILCQYTVSESAINLAFTLALIY